MSHSNQLHEVRITGGGVALFTLHVDLAGVLTRATRRVREAEEEPTPRRTVRLCHGQGAERRRRAVYAAVAGIEASGVKAVGA